MTSESKVSKPKELVRLRQRPAANGNISLYLDTYFKGQRRKESLGLYLNAGETQAQRKQNNITWQLAEQIKAQRIMDVQSERFKFARSMKDMSFLAYFEKLAIHRLNSKGNYGNWDSAYKHLLNFAGDRDITFEDVDEAFLNRFKHYLQNEKLTKSEKKLSQNSCHSYYNKIRAALRQAFEEKIIPDNPASRVRGIKAGETEREFLTKEEVERITNFNCNPPILKVAFLFSILTGLRWSDIQKMTWSEVRGSVTEGWFIRYQQKKTKDFEVLPITQEARDLLGESKEPHERTFRGLRYSAHVNVALSRWMLKSGIHRNITFHCARHTHATLLLSEGVDIYVVSKLLGHKHIKTTEIYAKVTNLKKTEAINKLPKLLI